MITFEVAKDKNNPSDWRVEGFAPDGACHTTIFTGPEAEKRAVYYQRFLSGSLQPKSDYWAALSPAEQIDALSAVRDKLWADHVEDIEKRLVLVALVEHVIAMADDAYLSGHPEWEAIVTEARAAKAEAEGE